MKQTTMTTGQIVGANLQRLRETARQTQSDVTRLIFEATGERWTCGKVSMLENGKRDGITLNELLTLACAYEVTLSALLATSDLVKVGRDFHVTPENLARQLTGEVPTPSGERESVRSPTPQIEADKAVAERLGVDVALVAATAAGLWGHTLTEERDARLGDMSGLPLRTIQGKRGAMTRTLTAEVATRVAALGWTPPAGDQ